MWFSEFRLRLHFAGCVRSPNVVPSGHQVSTDFDTHSAGVARSHKLSTIQELSITCSFQELSNHLFFWQANCSKSNRRYLSREKR